MKKLFGLLVVIVVLVGCDPASKPSSQDQPQQIFSPAKEMFGEPFHIYDLPRDASGFVNVKDWPMNRPVLYPDIFYVQPINGQPTTVFLDQGVYYMIATVYAPPPVIQRQPPVRTPCYFVVSILKQDCAANRNLIFVDQLGQGKITTCFQFEIASANPDEGFYQKDGTWHYRDVGDIRVLKIDVQVAKWDIYLYSDQHQWSKEYQDLILQQYAMERRLGRAAPGDVPGSLQYFEIESPLHPKATPNVKDATGQPETLEEFSSQLRARGRRMFAR